MLPCLWGDARGQSANMRIHVLNLEARLSGPGYELPAIYASGKMMVEGEEVSEAIFLSLSTIHALLQADRKRTERGIGEMISECVEHELIHSLTDWKHGLEVLVP